MKKSFALLCTIAATVGLLVVGCNKNANGPEDEGAPAGVSDEQSAMKVAAENDEFVKNDELTFSDQAITATDYVYVSGQVQATVTPIRWGRFISGITRQVTVTILPGDTIAVARVHKTINGTLKIRAITLLGDTILIEKPFSDESDRNVMFKRVRRGSDRFWLNWIPVATSLVDGGTPNGQIDIKSIELTTRGGTTITITDPLRYFLRYRWLRFLNGDRDMLEFNSTDSVRVKVILESASPDTDLVALRHGVNSQFRHRARMVLTSQVIGGTLGYIKTYEQRFFVHNRPGYFHAGVEAMTRATLYDDNVNAYSVSWWGVPYRVY
jgi:hypothetical protein